MAIWSFDLKVLIFDSWSCTPLSEIVSLGIFPCGLYMVSKQICLPPHINNIWYLPIISWLWSSPQSLERSKHNSNFQERKQSRNVKLQTNILIHKLKYYGITGLISSWIESFLAERTQQVVINGSACKPIQVTSGVPQGTVLGPLLFLLYINDLPNNLTLNVRLFADDCLLYQPVKSDNDISLLQNDLIKLEEWQNTWLMKFNPTKCFTMTLASRKPTPNIYTFDLWPTT